MGREMAMGKIVNSNFRSVHTPIAICAGPVNQIRIDYQEAGKSAMSDPEKKICRYFNTLGGCWYGDSCKFLHIPDKKPPCKFYGIQGIEDSWKCPYKLRRFVLMARGFSWNGPGIIHSVFKENVDPSELSGTNNNNMTQSIKSVATAPSLPVGAQDGTAGNELLTDTAKPETTIEPTEQADPPMNKPEDKLLHTYQTSQESEAIAQTTETEVLNAMHLHSSVTATEAHTASNLVTSTVSVPLIPSQQVTVSPDQPQTTVARATPELFSSRDMQIANNNATKVNDGQNYALTPFNGRPCGATNEIEIYCGSCKRSLERRGNESYCTLLKDHYLECFLDKEGDHVKYVKTKAALEPGQMYWCKSCILIFEKPWSLFQHMADKAKGTKVQRWEKKIHLDWMDSVAGLMAGYDLGLFSPAKLRIDLRNLLADQHTMEEEMEAAAVTAAAMMQWLAPLSSPWRLQQREMMRKIEQLNRQMLRKANLSLNSSMAGGGGGGYSMRGPLPIGPASASSAQQAISYGMPNRSHLHTPAHSQMLRSHVEQSEVPTIVNRSPIKSTATPNTQDAPSLLGLGPTDPDVTVNTDCNNEAVDPSFNIGSLGDVNDSEQMQSNEATPSPPAVSDGDEVVHATGAGGDMGTSTDVTTTNTNSDSPSPYSEVLETPESNDAMNNNTANDTNNTNSVVNYRQQHGASARGDEGGRRMDYKRGSSIYGQGLPAKLFNGSFGSVGPKSFHDSLRHPSHPRGPRNLSYNHPNISFASAGHRAAMHRANRMNLNNTTSIVPPSRGANTFNPPSFHASMDLNCGFTDEEVEELLSQGIQPWDSEAAAALAVLRGEMDHLLDQSNAVKW